MIFNPDLMNVIKKYICVLILFSSVKSIHAQYTDVINSSRPGTSRTAFSVGANVLQFELGTNYISEKHSLLKTETKGIGIDFAVRYGLFFEQLELNVEGTFQRDKVTNNSSSISFENKRSNFRFFAIGAKYLVFDPYKNADDKPNLYSWKANHSFQWKSLIPAVSVYAGVNIDSKNNPFLAPSVSGISPKVMIATQNNFSGGWVFVMNLIKDRIGSDQSDFQYILTLTHSFSQQWAVFAETQGIKSDIYADNLFRFGGAYLFNDKFQLDTAVTLNTKDTPSVFNLNLGASYRFDFHEDPDDNAETAEEKAKRSEREKGFKKKKKQSKKKKRSNKRKKKGEDEKSKKTKRQDDDFDLDDDGGLN